MNNSSLGTLGLTEPALPTPAWEAQECHAAWCHLWSSQHHLGSLPPSTGCEGGLGKVKASAAQGSLCLCSAAGTNAEQLVFIPPGSLPKFGDIFCLPPCIFSRPSTSRSSRWTAVPVWPHCPVSWLEFPPSDGHPYCVFSPDLLDTEWSLPSACPGHLEPDSSDSTVLLSPGACCLP